MIRYAQVNTKKNNRCLAITEHPIPPLKEDIPSHIKMIEISEEEFLNQSVLGKTWTGEKWEGESIKEKAIRLNNIEKINLSDINTTKTSLLSQHENDLIMRKMCEYLKKQGID